MIHVTIPKTANGEPTPLVKLGQGREDEHESGPLETVQTFAEKLRAAGYQEPMLPLSGAAAWNAMEQKRADTPVPPSPSAPESLPVVSREGFRAGVLSAIAGGAIIASIFLAWGLVAAGIFAASCVGFVAGMVITQEWK
jgi:hypothetical protein